MGNSKSKRSEFQGHERLDEHNPRYFARVQARNTISGAPSRWRLRRKRRGGFRQSSYDHQEDGDETYIPYRVGMLEATEELSSVPNNTKQVVSPLQQLTPLDTKKTAKPKKVRGNTKPMIKLPSPREGPSLRSAETASSISSGSMQSNRNTDYYKDMLDEASKESRDDLAMSEVRDVIRNFDAMLPRGVVWTEITRGSKVTCLALSPQQKSVPLLLAIGTEDGCVAVVEVLNEASSPRSVLYQEGLKKFGTIRELMWESKVRSLDFSPNGQWLAVGGDDCTATLVRIQFRRSIDKSPTLNGLEVVTELERDDRIYAVQFSPNGSLLAVGGFDGMVAIASLKDTGNGLSLELLTEVSRSGLVFSVDWSPDGTLLAVAGSDKCCAIVDDTWEVVGEIQRPSCVQSVNWSPDGTHLAVGCRDGTVSIVDIASREISSEVLRGHQRMDSEDGIVESGELPCQVNCMCWSYDGAFLAIGGSDSACVVVESQTFTVVHEVRRLGHINCVAWEQKVLAVGGDDRTVALLKTGHGEETDMSSVSDYSYDEHSSAASSTDVSPGVSPQNAWVLKDDFRDIDESLLQEPTPDISIDESLSDVAITAVAFSKAKKAAPSSFMAMASANGKVSVFNLKDWSRVAKLKFSRSIRALHFSRRSKFLALGGDDGLVCIVSVSDWQIVKEIRMNSAILTLGFSRTDESLAVGSSDGLLTLFGRKGNWNVIGEMDESASAVQALDWSRKHLAIGRADGLVTIHEAEKVHSNFFVPQAEFSRGSKQVCTVAFSVKGKYLAVAGADTKISIYSAKGGWVLCHQVKVTSKIMKVSWSSTGRYMGYCGGDRKRGGTIIDTLTWSEVDELRAQEPGIGVGEDLSCLTWSNNDKRVAFAGSSGVAHVVDTENWKLVHSLKHTGELCQEAMRSQDGVVQAKLDAKTTSSPEIPEDFGEERRKEIDPDAFDKRVAWSERPVVSNFLQISNLFLTPYLDNDPPLSLRVFVICILMLESHVVWISSQGENVTDEITRLDDGEPLRALFRILKTAAHVMTELIENERTVETWWKSSANFDLTQKDMRRMHAWNERWRQVDVNAPVVETSLLTTMDQLKANSVQSD